MTFSPGDERYMHRALALAKKGRGKVSPNPLVGCVFVKSGKVIAEGWHEKFGGSHAEILALRKIENKNLLRDATLYINLEPCVHYGKTPPCVPAIIDAGIRRVIIGMKDPNPLVNGKGLTLLKKAGIKVDIGCLEEKCRTLNEVFIKNMRTGMPFVTVKVAMSLDGKCATRTGKSKWITTEASRALVKKHRGEYDAILVGKNTVLQDNPELSAHSREPYRIVLDPSFTNPLSAKVFRNHRAILVTTTSAPKRKLRQLRKKGIAVKIFSHSIHLPSLLRWLYREKSIASIFVEGGPETSGSFFDAQYVDKVYFFIAPKIIGGREAKSALGGKGISHLKDIISLSSVKYRRVGLDQLLVGYPKFSVPRHFPKKL